MNEILSFIWEHKYILAQLVLLITVTLITIFKKKVKINDVFEIVLLILPELIKDAESNFQDGFDKYSYVFNKCIEMLVSLTKCQKAEILDRYTAPLNNAIENILSTPQKKVR